MPLPSDATFTNTWQPIQTGKNAQTLEKQKNGGVHALALEANISVQN
jgi:hypothetical protein